jgi:AAA15 family ATPase/GTPase
MHSGLLRNDNIDPRAISFLGAVGTGVVSHKVVEMKKSDIFDDATEFVKSILKKRFGNDFDASEFDEVAKIPLEISLAHKGPNENAVYLDYRSESDGTKRLLFLLGHIFRALDKGTVFITDELNASLHTQACEALVSLFASKETNPLGAQLIATTHDTNLLQSKSLRRDQVWFAEKTNEGATHIYPLTDIRTRKGDNLEKGYLQGRYGAVATTGSVKDVISAI